MVERRAPYRLRRRPPRLAAALLRLRRLLDRGMAPPAAAEIDLQALTAHIPGAVFQLALDRESREPRYRFVSEGIREILGLTPDQLLHEDKAVLRRMHPDDIPMMVQAMAVSVIALERLVVEFRVYHVNGRLRWLRTTAQPLREPDGTVVWNGMCQDVTDTREIRDALHESEARYALAMQAAAEGLWQWDLLSGATYLSPSLSALIGIEPPPPDEALAVYESHIHPGDLDRRREAVRLHLAGSTPSFSCEYRLCPVQGKPVWVLDRALVQRDETGRACRMAGSVENVTARKQFEAAIATARDEALAANRTKSEFLANMSHELRTPLNAIIGFASVIDEQILGPDKVAKYREYARDIRESGEHLLGLINDILDVAKIEAGKMDLAEETVAPQGVAEQAIRLMAQRAKAGGLALLLKAAPDLPTLRADPRKLLQIVLNLLSNAIKFTPSGGTIRLALERAEEGGLTLAVIDSGIGISAGNLAKALEPFGQIDSALTRRYEGTGLGLTLVQALARLHGAHFTLESELGQGTRACVAFPAERCVFQVTGA